MWLLLALCLLATSASADDNPLVKKLRNWLDRGDVHFEQVLRESGVFDERELTAMRKDFASPLAQGCATLLILEHAGRQTEQWRPALGTCVQYTTIEALLCLDASRADLHRAPRDTVERCKNTPAYHGGSLAYDAFIEQAYQDFSADLETLDSDEQRYQQRTQPFWDGLRNLRKKRGAIAVATVAVTALIGAGIAVPFFLSGDPQALSNGLMMAGMLLLSGTGTAGMILFMDPGETFRTMHDLVPGLKGQVERIERNYERVAEELNRAYRDTYPELAQATGRIAGLELARLEYTNLAYVRTILFEDGKHQVRTKFSQKHGMSMQLCTRRLGINFACRDIEEEFRP